MGAGPGVCVIESERIGPLSAKLERWRLDVRAVLPRFAELTAESMASFDIVIVGCDERSLMSGVFEASIRRMARLRPMVALVPQSSERIEIEAARVGFRGLISTAIVPAAVERAMAAVMRGELAFSRQALSTLAVSAVGDRSQIAALLTARQRQVVALVAQGATDDEIGRALGISASTAHKHVLGALRRAKAKTRGQLVAAVGRS